MGTLKRNAMHMFGSKILVALFQGIQFVLIARALGAHDFGRMSGVLAITAVLLPFSGVGAENVILIRLARGMGNAQVYFGNALLLATVTGSLLVFLYIFAGSLYLPTISTPLLLLIFGVSEIIITKYIDIAAHVFFGFERHAYSGLFYSLHGFIRMLFACLFFALFYHDAGLLQSLKSICAYFEFPSDNLELWAWFHLIAGFITSVFVLCITIRQIGWPTFNIRLVISEMRIGVFYSIGVSARSIYTNIDKSILVRFVSPEINGAYTAAFRLIYMSFTPVEAVLQAATARFLREGSNGIEPSFKMATQIVIYSSIYCLVFAFLLYICAPLIPYILGKSYVLSTDILRWLAFLPFMLMLQNAYSDALMGADRQMARSILQVIVAFICFWLNVTLVPKFSWMGSVAATYFSQMLLAILIIGLIGSLVRRERVNKPLIAQEG